MGGAILFSGIILVTLISSVIGRASVYNVVDFGAVGDGLKDDKQAFLNAWGAACADHSTSTMVIPSGKRFLLSQVTFRGPCKSEVHVQVSGNIVAPNKFWTNKPETWIIFININGLNVNGHGEIDGQGSIWWPCVTSGKCSAGAPYTIQFMGCNGLRLSGIHLKNSPGKHLAIYVCDWVLVSGITITAPGDSPNTDGMLIASSRHVAVSSSTIAVGDDCIAIGPGCSDVNVSRITCGPGHGISIGSLGNNSIVEKIRIFNSSIFQTLVGVRIKTWQGGSGYAKDITFEHINFTSVDLPVEINQFYCPRGNCANGTSAVALSDVTLYNLHGTSVNPVAIKMDCSQITACTGMVVNDVSFTVKGSGKPSQSTCTNAQGKMIGKVVPKLSCLKRQ